MALLVPGDFGSFLRAKADAYKYQSSMAMQNAAIANKMRKLFLMLANSRLRNKALPGPLRVGRLKAAQGASGLMLNYGSAKAVPRQPAPCFPDGPQHHPRRGREDCLYDFGQATNYETKPRAIPKPPATPEPKVPWCSVFVHRHGWLSLK